MRSRSKARKVRLTAAMAVWSAMPNAACRTGRGHRRQSRWCGELPAALGRVAQAVARG